VIQVTSAKLQFALAEFFVSRRENVEEDRSQRGLGHGIIYRALDQHGTMHKTSVVDSTLG
jgi:hypothetical protein